MLVDSFGHILQYDTDDPPTNITSLGGMAKEVAGRMNAADSPDMLESAANGIKWAIGWLNIGDRLRFMASKTDVLPLVAEQNTIAAPFNFIGVRQIDVLMNDSNPSYPTNLSPGQYPVATALVYENYRAFMANAPDELTDEAPVAWSARNTFADRTLLIRNRPSSTAAGYWSLRLHYDAPITLPTQFSDIISAPEDIEIVLKEGAFYYLLFERKRDDPTAYRQQFNIFLMIANKYKLNDQRRNANDGACWRIGDGA